MTAKGGKSLAMNLKSSTDHRRQYHTRERAERAETAEVVRFHDQVFVLTAEVSALKITIAQKDTDITLLDSRATHLKSALDNSQAACAEAGSLITSLTSDRDRLTSEVYLLF
ncbi:hypothetical protein Tco_0918261, partial [Tanacetum coccineum]